MKLPEATPTCHPFTTAPVGPEAGSLTVYQVSLKSKVLTSILFHSALSTECLLALPRLPCIHGQVRAVRKHAKRKDCARFCCILMILPWWPPVLPYHACGEVSIHGFVPKQVTQRRSQYTLFLRSTQQILATKVCADGVILTEMLRKAGRNHWQSGRLRKTRCRNASLHFLEVITEHMLGQFYGSIYCLH